MGFGQVTQANDLPADRGVVDGEVESVADEAREQAVDKAYFDSYSYFDIHREMLEDTVRTCAYRYSSTLDSCVVHSLSCCR
jgi:hypothetical protein